MQLGQIENREGTGGAGRVAPTKFRSDALAGAEVASGVDAVRCFLRRDPNSSSKGRRRVYASGATISRGYQQVRRPEASLLRQEWNAM